VYICYMEITQNTNTITIEQAKETFMFDFLLSEMRKRNTEELTQDIINAAYRKTVAFLNDEENKRKMMQRVKGYLK
jgi:hypothetical protein